MRIAENEKKRLGNNLKRVRESRSMSQSQLAEALWLDRSSVSGYESGKRVPDILILCRMAEILEVSLDELVGRIEDDSELTENEC